MSYFWSICSFVCLTHSNCCGLTLALFVNDFAPIGVCPCSLSIIFPFVYYLFKSDMLFSLDGNSKPCCTLMKKTVLF